MIQPSVQLTGKKTMRTLILCRREWTNIGHQKQKEEFVLCVYAFMFIDIRLEQARKLPHCADGMREKCENRNFEQVDEMARTTERDGLRIFAENTPLRL